MFWSSGDSEPVSTEEVEAAQVAIELPVGVYVQSILFPRLKKIFGL